MSEDTQLKVLKKIKIKKPSFTPNDIDLETMSGENLVSGFLSDMPENANSNSFSSSKNNEKSHDDDEFDQLLRDFIFSENTEDDDEERVDVTDLSAVIAQAKKEEETKEQNGREFLDNLRDQERNLFDAYLNFISSIKTMAEENKVKKPKFTINPKILYPKYKPRMGKEIANDTLLGWDIMLEIHSTRLSSISPGASDEELLDFAERTTDDNLQLAIISYVEILIEIEGCEIEYEKRRLKAKRKKIEKDIYLEHQKRANRAKGYIEKIKKEKFPIDAERLIKNFFKTSKKDAENAYMALITNPATFAPIDFSKIKPRLLGLIKVTPQDGIRMNKKIGDFLKRVKV